MVFERTMQPLSRTVLSHSSPSWRLFRGRRRHEQAAEECATPPSIASEIGDQEWSARFGAAFFGHGVTSKEQVFGRQYVSFWNLAVWTSIWSRCASNELNRRMGNSIAYSQSKVHKQQLIECDARDDRGIGRRRSVGELLQGLLGDLHHHQGGHALQGFPGPASLLFRRSDVRRSTGRHRRIQRFFRMSRISCSRSCLSCRELFYNRRERDVARSSHSTAE